LNDRPGGPAHTSGRCKAREPGVPGKPCGAGEPRGTLRGRLVWTRDGVGVRSWRRARLKQEDQSGYPGSKEQG
jgi:hypothetical protein